MSALLKAYRSATSSIVPILSLVMEFYIKHSAEEKISSHLSDVINQDIEIKLMEKFGTYKTFFRTNLLLKKTLPE